MLVSIWVITAIAWAIIILDSFLLNILFGTSWYAIPLFYIVAMIAFYIWHWMAHQRWTFYPLNVMYKIHMDHHWKIYPPVKGKFLSKEYQYKVENEDKAYQPGFFSFIKMIVSEHELPMHIMLILIFVGAGYLGESTATLIGAFFFLAVAGWFGVNLHYWLHIENHWLERYQWFHDLRALHLQHHRGGAKQNYNMYSFVTDAFLGTFEELDTGVEYPTSLKDEDRLINRGKKLVADKVHKFTQKDCYQFGDISIEVGKRIANSNIYDVVISKFVGF